MNIEINKFELLSFIKGHAFGSHLSQGVWERCVNEFYHKLDDHERNFIWHFAMAHIISDITKWKDEPVAINDIRKFVDRYDPDNQYIVKVKDEHGGGTYHAFLTTYEELLEGEAETRTVTNYHLGMTQTIPADYIQDFQRDLVRSALYQMNYFGRFDCEAVDVAKQSIRWRKEWGK